jgi:putative endonuclease
VRQYYVYILASRSRRLYVGVTNNLVVRLCQHRNSASGFTTRYHITRLVYFETTSNAMSAISREKQIKGWVRERKIALIKSTNPTWDDLAESWFPKTAPKADPSSLRSSG